MDVLVVVLWLACACLGLCLSHTDQKLKKLRADFDALRRRIEG